MHTSPAIELPAGRNARPLRCIEADGWQVTEKLYFAGRRMPSHAHDHAFITFFLAGAIGERSGSRHEVLRAGSWITKPAGAEHANRVGAWGARVLEFRWAGGGPAPRGPYGWHHGGTEALVFLKVYGALRGCGAAAAASIAGWCRGAPFETPREGSRHVPPWIGAVRDRLHARPRGAVSLGSLAAEFGVHPTYLARVFRRCYGYSIGEHTRELRVVRAARRIARGGMSLCEVALASGFADQSHMTRAFRAHTQMTPAQFGSWVRLSADAHGVGRPIAGGARSGPA